MVLPFREKLFVHEQAGGWWSRARNRYIDVGAQSWHVSFSCLLLYFAFTTFLPGPGFFSLSLFLPFIVYHRSRRLQEKQVACLFCGPDFLNFSSTGRIPSKSTYLTLVWFIVGTKTVIVRSNQREFECVFLASRYMTEWALREEDSVNTIRMRKKDSSMRTRWGAKRQRRTSKRICAGRGRNRGKIVGSFRNCLCSCTVWHVKTFFSL